MKYRLIFTLIILISISFHGHSQRRLWTVGTANTLGKKDLMIALFQPSAYGITDKLEVSSQPFLFPLAPNIAIKYKWYSKKNFSFASRHVIHNPTRLLNSSISSKLFDIIPEGSKAPQIISTNNEVLFSLGLGESICPSFTSQEFNRENTFKGPVIILTLKAGIQNGFTLDDNVIPVINKKYLFHHTYNYFDKYMAYAGFDVDGKWYKDFDFSADIEYLYLSDSYWAIEHKALVKWETGKKFINLIFGYQSSYGKYPNGNRFFIGPFIDILWIMRRDKIDYGLFGKKMF